jgi:hypothetical protein
MSDALAVRSWIDAGVASLENARRRIDDLNVYPVPDGDTGTNLTLTVRALRDSMRQSEAADRETIAHEVTRAILMGARGNSGVILSQIVRGGAEVLATSTGPIDATTLARALRASSDAAYRAVRKPVEGTMLSVIRELAEEAEARAQSAPHGGEFLLALVARGEAAVARTPEQLEILRDAGVVDAGGAGLLELLRGLVAAASGASVPEAPKALEAVGVDAVHRELSRYRYCTGFLVEGDALDRDELERELEQLGDSLLVVGDSTALKVHVHTDDPGAALSLGTARGVIHGVEIADMHEQTVRREERLLHLVEAAPQRTGVVAVAVGDGNRALFESLGVDRVVEGGQTMNPSTADLLTAIDGVRADGVVVLPNNGNVILAAEQAAQLSPRPVEVVPTGSIQAGLAAMVAFDASRAAAENADEMREAAASVVSGEVTIASRDVQLDGLAVRKGSWLGLVESRPVAGGDDFAAVASEVVERLLAEPREVLTLLTGDDEPSLEDLLERIAAAHPGVELDVHPGGQPHYPLLLSAE